MSRTLHAGMLSLTLLLASRVLGLLRESALAARFGVSALADTVVSMLTLPDLLASTLAAGALGYALLPWWARQTAEGQAASQRRLMHWLLALGAVLALWVGLQPAGMAWLLAPGMDDAGRSALASGLRWSALALPAALASALWYTRLQHDRDVLGMYGMNIVHTGVVLAMVAALSYVAVDAVAWMGAALMLAMAGRLFFLRWRLHALPRAVAWPSNPVSGLPPMSLWAWTLLATGLPVALPVVARSLMSSNGTGALATFSYAWKLVELPNLLAIQLVSALAFPAIARAHAQGRGLGLALRRALVLSWSLACAAVIALVWGSQPLAQLLFGWGRMQPQQVAEVAVWASWAAWSLLPQALIAVLGTVLATLQKMHIAAWAHGLALLVLIGSGAHAPASVMLGLTIALTCVAAVMLASTWAYIRHAIAWRECAPPLAACVCLAIVARWSPPLPPWWSLVLAGVLAFATMAFSTWFSPTLRGFIKRQQPP
jgi:putative peptidoglycan lipid II flippase